MLALSTDAVAPAEDASDLFGYVPRKPCRCPGCGLNAEPRWGQFCWLCYETGVAHSMLGDPRTTEAERDLWSGLKAEIRKGLVPTEAAMFEGED